MQGRRHDLGADDEQPNGYRMKIDPEAVEATGLHLLSSTLKFRTSYWIIPREHPLELLDLRVIFSVLRERNQSSDEGGGDDKSKSEDDHEQERLPFEAFQRAFERMFFVMQDPIQFDANAYDEDGDGHVAWGEFFRVYKRRNIKVHLSFCERLYLTFDNPESSVLSQVVSVLVLLTILISSVCFIMSTMPECHIRPESCSMLEAIEKGCLLIFVIEFGVRMCTVWAVRMEVHDKAKLQELVVGFDPIVLPTPWQRLWRFMRTPANIVDLAAILPGVLGTFIDADGGAFVVLRLVRLTRIFRAFKSPALVAPVIVIGRTLEKSTKALEVLAFNLCLGIVIFGSLMYMAEGGDDLKAFNIGGRWNSTTMYYERPIDRAWNGVEYEMVWEQSPFQSIPEAFWWAVVTAVTVGYGDHYPTTTAGYIVTVALMLFSMLILALPVGVMGGTFSQEWENFQCEKKDRAQTQSREMAYITRAITKLDPTKLSTLMLFEVWHDHPSIPCGEHERPPSSCFMGEAKVVLDTPMDRPVSKEMRIRLDENYEVAKRSVSGHLYVRYDWTPGKCVGGPIPRMDKSVSVDTATLLERFNVEGTLTVTAIKAENLINLSNNGGAPNPFVTLLCFPSYSRQDGPKPCFWRMPTARNKLSPTWNVSVTLDYKWCSQSDKVKRKLAQPAAGGAADEVASSEKRPSSRRPTKTLAAAEVPQQGGGDSSMQTALRVLRGLALELRDQRQEMRAVHDEVRSLADCVAQISSKREGPRCGAGAITPQHSPPLLSPDSSMHSEGVTSPISGAGVGRGRGNIATCKSPHSDSDDAEGSASVLLPGMLDDGQ